MIHTATDRTPYTYLIRHKATGLLYYGCRYRKGCHPDDLWVKYFTSSNYVKELIERDGKDAFEFEVRKVFNTVEACRNWEERVLMKVHALDHYLNRTYAPGIAPMPGKLNPMYGKNRPDAIEFMTKSNPMQNINVAKRVSNTLKQMYAAGDLTPRIPSVEEAEAISIRMIENNPLHNPENVAKMQATILEKYGKHHSAGAVWLANTITKIRTRCSPDDLFRYPESEGWIKLSNKKPIPA